MLKLFRHLVDEIDMVTHNLTDYPDPSEGLEDAGRLDWYTDKLGSARSDLQDAVERLERAVAKDQAAFAKKSSTEKGRLALLAERHNEATKLDSSQATSVAEGGSVTASGGTSGKEAAKGESSSGSSSRK